MTDFQIGKGAHQPPFFVYKTLILIACLLVFLQPFHSQPWTSAINDGLAICYGLLIILYACHCNKFPIIVKKSYFLVFISLLIFIILNTQAGSKSVIPYALTITVCWCCYHITKHNKIIFDLMLWSLAISALVSALVLIAIWMGVSHHIDMIKYNVADNPPFQKMNGLLGQSNNTGTHLILGILSTAHIYQKNFEKIYSDKLKNILFHISLSAIVICSIATAMVGSRTATLSFSAVSIIVLLNHKSLKVEYRKLIAHGILALALITWALSYFQLSPAGEHLPLGGRGLNSSYRIEVWQDFLKASVERPWFGYGVGGIGKAFVEHASPNIIYNAYFSHTHNVLIDMIIGLGYPVTIILVFLFAGFFVTKVIKNKFRDIFLIIIFIPLFIHSLLELPHHYVYFLIPSVIILSQVTMDRPIIDSSYIKLNRLIVTIVLLFLLIPLTYLLSDEYLQHEHQLRKAKLEYSIKGYATPAQKQIFTLVPELSHLNFFIRHDLSHNLSESDIEDLNNLLFIFPEKGLINRAIMLFTTNQKLDYALYWKSRLITIYGIASLAVGNRTSEHSYLID